MHASIVVASITLAALSLHADRILFLSSNLTERFALYTMADDGTDIAPVLTNFAHPIWSPAISGDQWTNMVIAFVSSASSVSNIFLTDLSGTGPAMVTNSGRALAVQFDAAGTIHYLRQAPGSRYGLWRINRNGTGERQVFSNAFQTFPIGFQSFHIDTNRNEALLSSFSIRADIFRGSLASTSAAATLITYPAFLDHYAPAASPDSTRIAYIADYGTGDHRVVVSPNINGTQAYVQAGGWYSGNPSWSPDGSWIAYTRSRSSTFGANTYVGDILKVQPDGSGTVNLTTNTVHRSGCAFPLFYNIVPEPAAALAAAAALAFAARRGRL
ncbi:hypothetical protein GX586_16495 [bacterium]|nr:hypothetical protein [bacterium]